MSRDFQLGEKGFIGLIPARGGSKGIAHKNMRKLGERPLLSYAIEAARQSGRISRIIVSTDDPVAAEFASQEGVEAWARPEHLATDGALTIDVVCDVLTRESWDLRALGVVLLQPTSPLRTPNHVREAVDMFLDTGASSVISVTNEPHHPFKSFSIRDGCLSPLWGIESLGAPRQSLPPVYRQNGAIYVAHAEDLLNARTFFIEPCVPYIMNAISSIDIDTETDIAVAQTLMDAPHAEQ